MSHRDIAAEAQGKWKGILQAVGLSSSFLTGKHGPCPMCGGTDRFRFDNKGGKGSWICSHCGAGDGFTLLDRLKGWDFKTAKAEVAAIIGGSPLPAERQKAEPTEEELKAERNALWKSSTAVVRSDVVGRYLASRGFEPDTYPADLRTCMQCPVSGLPGVSVLPAMLAMVRDGNGRPTTLHRTYLQNAEKARIPSPKRVCRGSYARGAAIRLAPWSVGEHLGVAEGVETALAAAAMFKHPVWSTLDAGNMEAFAPPAGCTTLAIYGDGDTSYRGQKAAYTLANRLRERAETKHIEVQVVLADAMDIDFADEWLLQVREARGELA